jgi:hypothetical protein
VVHEQWDDALKLAVHLGAELEMSGASWSGFRELTISRQRDSMSLLLWAV